MVFNMYDHQNTVDPGDISATVCPMMEATRYYRVLSDGMSANKDKKRNRGGRQRRANTGHKEMEPGRPPEFREFLWRLVAPENWSVVHDQFDSDLTKYIDAMYGLMLLTNPWIERVPESLETPEGSQVHMKEAAAQ